MIKILIADDNNLTRVIIKKMLSSYNEALSIEEALDGKSALQQIIESKFDILFLDLNMPTLSGFNVANYIKNKEIGSMVIVAISANLDEKNVAFLQSLGVEHFIPKPFEKKQFDDMILPIIQSLK